MKVSDFHSDILTHANEWEKEIKKYKIEELFVVCAVFRGKRGEDEVYRIVNDFKRLSPENCLIALEDAGYLKEDGELVDYINPVYCTLTWNGENELGYGSDYDLPLKRRGEQIIKVLNSKKVFIDTAHSNQKSFCDIITMSDIVIDSHTCFNKICPHRRNISDEQISMLIDKKGIIGITFVPEFLSGEFPHKQVTSDDVIRHIDHFVQKFGYEHLCIGSDFYGTDSLPTDLSDYKNMPVLVEKLEKLGYNSEAVKGIMSENLKAFLKKHGKII